jgi:pyrimidine operon attenuation protein / uracil phosphoribosyltransferase
METGKIISDKEHFALVINRLCYELLENYDQFENTCLIGIQSRGAMLSDRLIERLRVISPDYLPLYGKLDITFYRDDYRQKGRILKAESTEIHFAVDKTNVILVDDVLYSGRTIQAALAALNDLGRPERVEVLTLVDRRFNRHLPISSDYTGMTVDALDEAYVKVEWQHLHGQDRVVFFPGQKELKS